MIILIEVSMEPPEFEAVTVWLESPRSRAIPVIEPSSRIVSPLGRGGFADHMSAVPPMTSGEPKEHSSPKVHGKTSERYWMEYGAAATTLISMVVAAEPTAFVPMMV
ncbi:MAG: hypothetical protein CXT65_06190 [Methanobacteriota archaeon]|nr:MAG: hypothetical protein CXT65_06190 [Euryarchaeota archaeon]